MLVGLNENYNNTGSQQINKERLAGGGHGPARASSTVESVQVRLKVTRVAEQQVSGGR